MGKVLPLGSAEPVGRVREFLFAQDPFSTECWEWPYAQYENGYGKAQRRRTDGRKTTTTAHRAIYEALIGPIPEGMQLHHLCGNPACCNPAHLEPMAQTKNLNLTRRTHCKRGHRMTPENLYVPPGRPDARGDCRECIRIRTRRTA